MTFNSLIFVVFLGGVFSAHWFVFSRRPQTQNVAIVAASYLFYGLWDWRFLGLILVSTVVDYFVGIHLGKTDDPVRRKQLLGLSLVVNLGILGVFKYFNFFTDSFVDLAHWIGFDFARPSLHLVLPVGISFYTFQTMGYAIDVYRRKVQPETSPVVFAAYVSFFPQLVAGPIERSTTLLPQFRKLRAFDDQMARDGCRQMLCGFFKKIVIADNCATVVNAAFGNYESTPASALVVGAFCFAIQIYSDFSGYSDIAIGTAKLFGVDLMKNFDYPLFSRNIAEFWRRWHISLSNWFRDYVFLPMGGMRQRPWLRLRNILVLFVLIGVWHGANWTFVLYGLIQGILVATVVLRKKRAKWTTMPAEGRWFPQPMEALSILLTFGMNCVASVVFRSESVSHAFGYFSATLDASILQIPTNLWGGLPGVVLLTIEWFYRYRDHILDIADYPIAVRWPIYWAYILAILVFGEFGSQDFIYFQF